MTLGDAAALFGVLTVLAVVPSVSVLAVSARSAASGFVHGLFTTLGIVAGDVFFIVIAIFGLSVLAEAMDGFFILVKYLGGAYLIWLGARIWRSKATAVEPQGTAQSSLPSSFLTGLFITLGDQKAILFYLGFFPAFFDLSAISGFDAGIIIAIAVVSVGGAKLAYAFLADRTRLLSGADTRRIHAIAGGVVVAAGVFVLVKA